VHINIVLKVKMGRKGVSSMAYHRDYCARNTIPAFKCDLLAALSSLYARVLPEKPSHVAPVEWG
jgi:hypothetical protein